MSASARITIEPAMAETPAKPKRRRHSVAEKRQIVEESFDPKTSVARVARVHEINANQVFAWRRLYQRGQLGGTARPAQAAGLLPVTISDSAAAPAPMPTPIPPPALAGTIQLHVPRGRLHIEGAVDFIARRAGMPAGMMTVPAGAQIWIAAGVTDLRRGFTGLSAIVRMIHIRTFSALSHLGYRAKMWSVSLLRQVHNRQGKASIDGRGRPTPRREP
jgi:transposase